MIVKLKPIYVRVILLDNSTGKNILRFSEIQEAETIIDTY